MKIKDFVNTYDSMETLVVISLYPKRGELYSTGTSGVASYTKNLVTNLKRKVIILANIDERPEVYEEENALVIRCFRPGSPLMWLDTLKALSEFKFVGRILVQFDFAVYGGILTSSLVIPFVFILRLSKYKTSILLHHVILDIRKLSGHVGLGTGSIDSIKAFLYNVLFRIFYTSLHLLTSQIIVLEDTLKNKLQAIIGSSKVYAIPHGVDTNLKPMLKSKARKILGIKSDEHVILFFGFINWFKGADVFAKIFNDQDKILGKKTRSIIAGGISPTLKNKRYYQIYVSNLMQSISASGNVQIEGYIPQEKICAYFSAADLIVFPYRYFMTASGVLSLSFSYKKPFIVSKQLGEMFRSQDLTESLKRAGLEEKNFIFDLNQTSCITLTKKVLKNGIKARVRRFTNIVREDRSYKNTALLFDKAIFQAPIRVAPQRRIALNYSYGK